METLECLFAADQVLLRRSENVLHIWDKALNENEFKENEIISNIQTGKQT